MSAMSFKASTSTHNAPQMEPLPARSALVVALGIIFFLVGFGALASVIFATVVTVYVVGIMMLVAAAAQIFSAFQVKTWGKASLWLMLGVLYLLAGFATFNNPFLAAALFTLLLAISLVASGVMRMILAFTMKEGSSWIWLALSGTITVLLGIVIFAHWPISGLYILGLFLGIDLILTGLSWIGVGLGMRRHRPT